jgi:threonylcarbamoyladenosine tRNA methylthiotransferase MtaB
MNISFYTLGCKLNYAETSTLREQFENAGHSVVEFGEPTDAVIINTCTVTENADTECRKIIRRALRSSPNAFIGVTGCYAQLQPEEIASIEGVDAVFGSKEKFSIPQIFKEFHKIETPQIHVSDLAEVEFVEAHSSDNDSRSRAFLKLQDGCNYNCSFCTIPLARGASRSMKFTDIMPRINSIIQAGFHEIVLSGINLGDYRANSAERFIDVLRLIESQNPNARFRISSIEPNLLTPEIIDLVANSNVIVPHFHIPLQSGSPEILKKMRRRYNSDYYHSLIMNIKSKIPDCCIGIDVIVGFPGETDSYFEETFQFLHQLPLSYLHVFTYSERENTPAAVYSPKVAPHVRKERTNRLRTLSAKKKNEFYGSQIGKVHTIIPESYNLETNLWIGWTENYVRTEFAASPSLIQIPMLIQLDEIKGETVLGSLLEVQQLAAQNTPDYYSILF